MAVCLLSPAQKKSVHQSSQLDEDSSRSSSDDEASSCEERNPESSSQLPHPKLSFEERTAQSRSLRLAWRTRQRLLKIYHSTVCGDRRRTFILPPNLPWPFSEPITSTGLGSGESGDEEHDADSKSTMATIEVAVEEWLASLRYLAKATSSLKGSLSGHINQCTQVPSHAIQFY